MASGAAGVQSPNNVAARKEFQVSSTQDTSPVQVGLAQPGLFQPDQPQT